MSEQISTKGYGAEVKQLAEELRTTGVATLDLTGSGSQIGGEDYRIKSRAYGYGRSLSRIFDRPVRMYEHNPDVETGDRFLAFAFE